MKKGLFIILVASIFVSGCALSIGKQDLRNSPHIIALNIGNQYVENSSGPALNIGNQKLENHSGSACNIGDQKIVGKEE